MCLRGRVFVGAQDLLSIHILTYLLNCCLYIYIYTDMHACPVHHGGVKIQRNVDFQVGEDPETQLPLPRKPQTCA